MIKTPTDGGLPLPFAVDIGMGMYSFEDLGSTPGASIGPDPTNGATNPFLLLKANASSGTAMAIIGLRQALINPVLQDFEMLLTLDIPTISIAGWTVSAGLVDVFAGLDQAVLITASGADWHANVIGGAILSDAVVLAVAGGRASFRIVGNYVAGTITYYWERISGAKGSAVLTPVPYPAGLLFPCAYVSASEEETDLDVATFRINPPSPTQTVLP